MTDREKDIKAMSDIVGKNAEYVRKIWEKFGSGWDGAWCSETACVISYLGGNIDKIPISNYAEGLMQKFKERGKWGKMPEKGAFVIFGVNGVPNHTGRVKTFDSQYIYTVEGNINGAVVEYTRPRSSNYILGYGYPNYKEENKAINVELDELSKGSSGALVSAMQAILKGKFGYNIDIDGDFGSFTRDFLVDFQRKHNLYDDGLCGRYTWNKLLY